MLDQFVSELEFGIDTPISEWGSNLSGGQKQRIGIARTLLTGPKLVFLDEATSALDAHTESIFNLRSSEIFKDVTLISVAHKLKTIRQATKILVLDDGLIKGFGSFEELYTSNELFRDQIGLMEDPK